MASTTVICFPKNKSPSTVGANIVKPASPNPIAARKQRNGQYDWRGNENNNNVRTIGGTEQYMHVYINKGFMPSIISINLLLA